MLDADKISRCIARHEPNGIFDDFTDIVEYAIENRFTVEECLAMVRKDTCYVIGSDPVFESELRSLWGCSAN